MAGSSDIGWLDSHDAEALASLAGTLGVDERELVRRAVHAFVHPTTDGDERAVWAAHARNQQALLSLVRQEAFGGNDLNAALKAITEVAALTADVERVGIWLYKDNYTRIECIDVYQRDLGLHAQGEDVGKDVAPAYFAAIEVDRVVAAEDARHDPRTVELGAYMEQHGIHSMLDAPMHIEGKTAGIVCLESQSPREWTTEMRNFAASLGDMASLVFAQAEKRRSEIEIIRQTVALEKAKELNDVMSGFVSMVAHEFRSPLTSVLGFIELLEERTEQAGGSEAATYFQQLRQGVDRFARLVDDLVDFSRLERGSFQLAPQDADLAAKVCEVAQGFYPQALAARVDLVVEAPDDELTMRLDPGRIGQVLANLIGNAIKFTPAGGRVVVRVLPASEGTRVEVHDTGVAIAPEDLPRLFSRFSQLEAGRGKGGMGLGLYIAKSLVQAHGGEMGVESALGHGSTFWFSLPPGGAPA